MKASLLTACLLSWANLVCFGQQTTPATSQRSNADQKRQQNRESMSVDRSFEALRQLDVPVTINPTAKNISNERIQTLYRRSNKEDAKVLSPSSAVTAKYESFLREPNTGMTKLNGDSACYVTPGVVVVSQSCSSFKLPGAGTAFSFRVRDYQMLHLADLILERGILKTDGLRQQGIMVNLGDIELDKISENTPGLKYLLEFPVATTLEDFAKYDAKLIEGIKKDGFNYRLGFFADEKTTFALRSIAYRGKMMRSVDGVNYNEFDFDKRKDVTVVFRVVEKDFNGDVTIIWKEIAKRDAPNMTFDRKD